MASIAVIQGPDKGRKYELTAGDNVIGRGESGVALTDKTCSRAHARLVSRDGIWLLEDCGSANGTYLNGMRLSRPQPIHQGDQIRCGGTLLVFGGGPAQPMASVDVDEDGNLVDAAIVATLPSNEDSVIIPTPEAGAAAIGSLRILYDLIAQVSSIFNVDMLLRQTLDKIFNVLKVDRGFIMLLDASGELRVRASRTSGEMFTGGSPPVSRTIINEVMRKRVGILSTNAMSDKRFTSGKSVHDFGIRSAICVPIPGRTQIVGVIHVDNTVSEQTYSTEQLRLLTAIGYQTGLAVENVRLHETAVQTERLAAVGETVALLSHHIKNILQALGGGVELVEKGLQRRDVDKALSAWPIVERNLGRINELILNMLALGKNREPLLETININRVLQECLELVGPRADERGVAVLSDLDEMPAIPADAAGLGQAFMNLLTNALEVVADETGAITVSSKYDTMLRQVVVTIADNGPGIAPELRDRIFTPFFSSKGQKGTGLGLAVAQKIVREHRGKIVVESAVGHGASFTITLPAIPGRDPGDTDHSMK